MYLLCKIGIAKNVCIVKLGICTNLYINRYKEGFFKPVKFKKICAQPTVKLGICTKLLINR